MSLRARITAKPMRWVNETLPPRTRVRWLLMTIRLSMRSFAGTARTVVAVGTSRLVIMFAAMALDGPRSVVTMSSSTVSSFADFGSWAGIRPVVDGLAPSRTTAAAPFFGAGAAVGWAAGGAD